MPTAVETLECRRHFTATTRPDPMFGFVQTDLGGWRDVATNVAPLPDGHVLVSGLTVSDDATYSIRDAFVMYDAAGRPDPKFGRNGVLIQSAASFAKTNNVAALTALPDGSVLVEQSDGIHRLRSNGTFDASFGQKGKLAGIVGNAFVNADGTIAAFDFGATDAGQFRLRTYDAKGRSIATSAPVPGDATHLAGGRIAGITADNRVTLYDARLRPVNTFGSGGLVQLNATLRKWVAGQGKWYDRGQLLTKPAARVRALTPAVDGGWVVSASVNGSHRAASSSGVVTRLSVRLDAAGRVVRVDNGDVGRAGVRFEAAAGIFGGMFRYGAGRPVALQSLVSGDVYATARAADGSFYIAGQVDNHIALLRTTPVVARITGVAFGDTNRDGLRQPNESVFSDKRVYLDANNNGRLDAGEARTATDATGRYTFNDLGPGNYVVRRELPAGYRATTSLKPISLVAGNDLELDLGSIAT